VIQAPNPKANGNTPVDHVLNHLQGVRRSGAGWTARCPNHDDRQASLSVKEGDDGRVLLHCFASCANADIVMSAGLSFPDLFPAGTRERLKSRTWMGVIPMNPNGRPALASFGDDRVAALLGELARLAKVRGTLDKPVATALRALAAAVGVSPERLTEAVRAALATEESS
jgi:hypothetical protein